MKILKFVGKFILLPIIVLTLCFVLYFAINNRFYLGGQDAVHIAYLKQNNAVLNKSDMNFNSFDSLFSDNTIFILSENHGYEDVQSIDEQLFIHLNKTQGVRYYIAEMDSLIAKELNIFLNNPIADKALLKAVVQSISDIIPQQSSQQLMDKWLRIHAYNLTLNDSLKIEILGLDKNRNDTSRIGRDSSMLLNFNALVQKKHLENQKFYGLFGYYHGMQSGVTERNTYPFAAKLKRNNNFPQFRKVQTIACLTLESEMYMPPYEGMPTPPDKKTALFNVEGSIALTKGIHDAKAVSSPNTLTLFHLDKPNSPYRNSQRLAGIKINLLGDEVLPNNAQQATTDFYQHVILIRGSKSLLPLE